MSRIPEDKSRRLITNIDPIAGLLYIVLLVIGWINIYSSEYHENMAKVIDMSMSHGKQLIWISISLVLAFFIVLMDSRIYHTIAYLFYAFSLSLLLTTLVIGKTVAGAKGWIVIGGFQLQTAEIAKVGTVLALARHLSTHGVDIRNTRDRMIAFAIIMLPCLLVLLQNDTGSALVFLSLFFILYRVGLSAWYLIIPVWLGIISLTVLMADKKPVLIGLGAITLVALFIVRRQPKLMFIMLGIAALSAGITFGVDYGVNHILKDYQRERIDVLLGKEVDVKGAGYNVHQSLIAIGSGGFSGKGFLKGTQTKYDFVPEQSTDFIFCTIGEEYGFLGSATVIILYLVLMWRIVTIAERQKFLFNRVYAYGVLSIIFIHFTINIGMTLGIFPVIGIPLPFISYGGSSFIAFTILLFILLKLDASDRYYGLD
jgi:rod shape determining protein RodA